MNRQKLMRLRKYRENKQAEAANKRKTGDKGRSWDSKRVQALLETFGIFLSLTLHCNKLQYILLFLIPSNEPLFLVSKHTCQSKKQCQKWGRMEPDTCEQCRVFKTSNQSTEKVFKTWDRSLRFHFKQQCNGTLSYYLQSLMSQITSADEALGIWVATELFKGDRLYRAVGIR